MLTIYHSGRTRLPAGYIPRIPASTLKTSNMPDAKPLRRLSSLCAAHRLELELELHMSQISGHVAEDRLRRAGAPSFERATQYVH